MSLHSLRLSLRISVLRVGCDILSHSRPIPPVVVNTSGVKDACSTSRTRLSYILFFSFSLRRYTCSGVRSIYESAFGWHTLISKKVDFSLSQNPRAWMSRRASQAKFAPLFKVSPVISCRTGSVFTSLQTRSSKSASRSRSSLWRVIVNTKALSTHTNGGCACYFSIIP